MKLTVSAIDIKAKSDSTCCRALVRWSYTQGGTLRACNTPLTLVDPGTPPSPANLPNSIPYANRDAGFGHAAGLSSHLIVADVSYTSRPFFLKAAARFGSGLTKSTCLVPRSTSGPVTLASPVDAAPGQSGAICF